jgi:hypothetical protein
MKRYRLTHSATWPKGIAAEASTRTTIRGRVLATLFMLAEQNNGWITEDQFIARVRRLNLGSATPHDFWNWIKRTGICK